MKSEYKVGVMLHSTNYEPTIKCQEDKNLETDL